MPKATYSAHHRDYAEGHVYIDKVGACTITLTGASSMTQDELDRYGRLFAAAIEKSRLRVRTNES